MNFKENRLISFDAKSLFTNLLVDGAMDTVIKTLNVISNVELPLYKSDYVELIYTCVKYGTFRFSGVEYKKHESPTIDSPLLTVMASFYMEVLE